MANDVALVDFIVKTDPKTKHKKFPGNSNPHTGKGGLFLWAITNETTDPIQIEVTNFSPIGFVEIDTPNPIDIDPDQEGYIVGRVIKALKKGKKQTVTYWMNIDGIQNDPDLIVDGDPTAPPPVKKSKGRKKTAAKKR